jgi:hypothetical protein
MSKVSAKQRVEQLQGWLLFIKAEAIRKGKKRK